MRAIWALLLLVAALPLGAQPLAFRRYDSRDGLPGSQVFSLLEDRHGFLWVANNNALARLGSGGFSVFQQEGDPSTREVSALLQDRDLSLWAATSNDGLLELRGSRILRYGPESGLTVPELFALAEGPGGTLFVGTRQGLFQRSGSRFTPVPLPGRWAQAPIYALSSDDQGGLWLGGRAGMLARWDGQTLVEVPAPERLSRDWLVALCYQPGQGLWVVTSTALSRVGPDRRWVEVPLPGIGPVRPRSLTLSRQGELLIALGTQGLLIRNADGTLHLLGAREGIPATGVHAALRDRTGALWLGTDGDGLICQSTKGLHALDLDLETHASLGLGAVAKILEARPGVHFLGSSHGLFRHEAGRGITRRWHQRHGLPANDVYDLGILPGGDLVLATARGLARLQGEQVHPFAPALAQVVTFAVLVDPDRFWVASDHGLAELHLDGRLIQWHHPPQDVGREAIFGVVRSGSRILATTRLGLLALDPSSRSLQRVFADAPFGDWSIASLRVAPDGRLLVGTQRGVFIQDTAQHGWRHIPEGPDLPDGSISWVETLRNGTLAVGHGRGVSLIGPRGSVHLTRNSGLISDETNQEASLVDSRGALWFGMVGGVCVLDPLEFDVPSPLPPPVLHEAAWVGGQAIFPRELNLEAHHGTLRLSLEVPQPDLPLPVRYQVRLEGHQGGWTDLPGRSPQATFSRLDGGRYTLHLRASVDGRTWVEGAPVTLRIARSWHQHWTVRFLGLAGLLGLVLLLLRQRTRALERSNRLLEASVAARTEELVLRNQSLERLHGQLKQNLESRARLISTVSHDLRSPLTSILVSTELLQSGGSQEKALRVITREAQRLEQILRTLLDRSRHEAFLENLNPRVCHPTEIVTGLSDTLLLRAERQELRCEVTLDPRASSVWILADIPIIQQVLFNLLENALKFTPSPGTVGLRTEVAEETFRFEVWDTGRGIAVDDQERIFAAFEQTDPGDRKEGWGLGLSICKELVEAHQGRITVDSTPGRGSTFRVTLPLLAPQAEGQGE